MSPAQKLDTHHKALTLNHCGNVHQVPPGVPVMKEKRAEISYIFEELPSGGRVRLKTTNLDARKAIYDFLRFQIEDHHTRDSVDINSL